MALPNSRVRHGQKLLTQTIESDLVGCALLICCAGYAGGTGGASTAPGQTDVTVLATSTANDQVAAFDLVFESLF